MTYTEAKKEINSRIELANRHYRDQIPDYIEALEMASEALKRQMPMKPKIDGEFGLCKTCNYVFNSELVSEYCVKHCPNCGQAIDWSEE